MVMPAVALVDSILEKLFEGIADYAIGKSVYDFSVEDFVTTFKFGISTSNIMNLVKDWDYFNGAEYERYEPRYGRTLATRITLRFHIDKTYEREWFVRPTGDVW